MFLDSVKVMNFHESLASRYNNLMINNFAVSEQTASREQISKFFEIKNKFIYIQGDLSVKCNYIFAILNFQISNVENSACQNNIVLTQNYFFVVFISMKKNNTNRPTHIVLRIKTVHHACKRPEQFKPVAAKRLYWITIDERWMRALKSNFV